MTAPTAARRILGNLLRTLRDSARISTADAANAIRGSDSKVRRIERGAVTLVQRDLDDLLALYKPSDDDEKRARELFAKSDDGPAWWGRYSDLTPEWFRQFLGYEHAATRTVMYDAMIVPTLLQTSDYLSGGTASTDIHPDPAVGRRWADLHLSRQRGLVERRTPITFYIEQSAITRALADSATHRNQVLALAEPADNVTVRVVPHTLDSWVTQTGPFVMMWFEEDIDGTVPPVIYHEHLTGAIFLGERESDVAEYARVINRLDQMAMSAEQSRGWLREFADTVG